ncbi:MAG: hypothetical protein KHX34_06700 [Clostridiales bacterium]|nr:hypothetical protein [Clostridiales bacterium]
MSTLVVLASVFALAGGGALLLRRRLEEALPLSVVLIVGVQYAFGLFGWLSAGFYAALALSVLALVLVAVRLLRGGLGDLRRFLLTPGAVVMLAAFVWALLSFRAHMLYEPDEFSHWGTVLRNMMHFDAIPAGVKEANITYTDYPPATTLFAYFWTRLSGGFNEGDPQRAMNIMILAFLLPAMRAQRWKRWGSALCMACALFVLPTLFNSGAYYTIYADVVLGCVFFHALYAWFFTPRDRGGVLLTGGSLFLLPLIKEAGWGLCLIALAVMAADLAGERRRAGPRHGRAFGALAAAAMAGGLSWKAFLAVHQTRRVWTLSAGFTEILDVLLGRAPSHRMRTVENFFLSLTDAELFGQGGVLRLSLLLWLLLLGVLAALALSRAGEPNRTRWRRMALWLLAGLGAYLLSLLYTFLFLFRNYEGESLFSFARYLSSYLIALAGLSLALASETLGPVLRRSGQSVELLALAAVMLVANPGTLLERAVITREWDEAVYESRMSAAAPPEAAQMLDAQTDRVYLVSQNDEGHRYFLRAFEWAPLRLQARADGWWLMPSEQAVEQTGDWYARTFSTVKTPQEWADELIEGGYTHVYLDRIDPAFAAAYAGLFQSPEEIEADTLFEVAVGDGGATLVRADGQ